MQFWPKRVMWIHPSPLQLAAWWVRSRVLRQQVSPLPKSLPEGIRLHVGAGQNIIEGYENLDAYDNEQRPDFFQTQVKQFVRAEALDTVYQPESVAEIRCHHMFEHISMLDVDRTLQGWNRILKPGGLLWIEVPDFEGCARQILKLKREDDKEIFYRHIFGSQVGPGEFHYNGLTARRLIKLLQNYGFEVKLAYVIWTRRVPRKPDMFYPSDVPLPDLTVKAIKVGSPKPEVINAEWTYIAYRKQYPNPELENLSSSSGSNDCGH
jgi:SAM-dependent methyltransferase